MTILPLRWFNLVQLQYYFICLFLSDRQYNPHTLCLVVYYIPNGFTPTIVPHGNSKSGTSYYATLPGMSAHIKEECKHSGPKHTVARVSASKGGIVCASYPGELPRNDQQVSNFKGKKIFTSNEKTIADGDALYTVMFRAQMDDSGNKFARDIKAYPNPTILLASDRQSNYVGRFCCDSFESCVLTIDPTFSLGDFDVTPAMYHHLLLQSSPTGKTPVMIGPVLVHYKKDFQHTSFLLLL